MMKYLLCFLIVTSVLGVGTIYGPAGRPARSAVYASLSAMDTTIVGTGGTYYAIVGSFTNAPITGFTALGGPPPGIRYDGGSDRVYEIDWHATVHGDSNAMTIHFGIAIDGTVPMASSIMGTYLKTSGEPQAMSGTAVITLSNAEVVTLVATADDDGDLVIVDHYTVSIRPLYAH